MATIGLSKPYYGIYSASGTTVTYANGAVMGKATEANIEISFPQMDVHLRENETVPVELRNPRKVKEPTLQQEDKSDAPEQNG